MRTVDSYIWRTGDCGLAHRANWRTTDSYIATSPHVARGHFCDIVRLIMKGRPLLRACAFGLVALATSSRLGAQPATQSIRDSTARDPHSVQPERPTVATHAGTVAPGWVEL